MDSEIYKDASNLVKILRVVKCKRKLIYLRRAAQFDDDAQDEVYKLVKPGFDENQLLAVMQGVIFRGGYYYPSNEFIIGSGENTLLCRYYLGRRKLS